MTLFNNKINNLLLLIFSLILAACTPANESNGNVGSPIINAFSTNAISTTAISIQFISNQAGTAYYVLQLGGSEPSVEQIKNGTGNGGVIISTGSQQINVGINFADFDNLSAGTTYTLYVMGENAEGLQSSIGFTDLTTTGIFAPPVDPNVPVVSVINVDAAVFRATAQFSSDSAGRAYFLVQSGGSAPSKLQLQDGVSNGGSVVFFSNSNVDEGNNIVALRSLLGGTDYTFYIMVEDSAGNNSNIVSRVFRTLDVDITAPVISLQGDNPQNISFGNEYVEQSATALDDLDGDISANIIIDSSAVNTNALGRYLVSYSVTDNFENSARVERVVNVIDDLAPVISLAGINPQIIQVNTAYNELAASAIDNVDGNITFNINIDASLVDVTTVGNYTVTYNVSDAAGNVAETVSRNVKVVNSAVTDETFVSTMPSEIGVSLDIKIDNSIAYIVGANGCSLFALDISFPSAANIIARYDVPLYTDNAGNSLCEQITTVEISGNKIYLAGSGLWILDKTLYLENKEAALLEKNKDAAFDNDFTGRIISHSKTMKIVGDYLYVTGHIQNKNTASGGTISGDGVIVFDISDTSKYLPVASYIPTITKSSTNTAFDGAGSNPSSLDIKANTLYFSWGNSREFWLVDINNPLKPIAIKSIATKKNATIAVSDNGNYLYEFKDSSRAQVIYIYDLANSDNPIVVSKYEISEAVLLSSSVSAWVNANNKLYVSTEVGVLVIDASEATSLRLVDRIPFMAKQIDFMAILNNDVYSVTNHQARNLYPNRIDRAFGNYLIGSLNRINDVKPYTRGMAVQDPYKATIFDNNIIYLSSIDYSDFSIDGVLSDETGTLTALNITDPVRQSVVSTTSISASKMIVSGDVLITNGQALSNGFRIIDVSDPASPQETLQYKHSNIYVLAADATSSFHQTPTIYFQGLNFENSANEGLFQASIANLPSSLDIGERVAGTELPGGAIGPLSSITIPATQTVSKQRFLYYVSFRGIKRASINTSTTNFSVADDRSAAVASSIEAISKDIVLAGIVSRTTLDKSELQVIDWSLLVSGGNEIISSINFDSAITDITVDAQIAYVTTLEGITLVDISDLTKMKKLRTIRTLYPAVGFALLKDLLLIKDAKGLSIYRKSDL